MAGQAVLLHRLVLPQEGAALLRVALITGFINREAHEHFASLAPVRVVAGDAIYFHHLVLCAEEMCGPLELSLSLIGVATETGLFNGEARQHVVGRTGVYQVRVPGLQRTLTAGPERLGELRVVGTVARHAAHVVAVVFAALPVVKITVARVTLEACLIRQRRIHLGRVADIRAALLLGALLGVLVAVVVAEFTLGRARVGQELGALTVDFERKGFHYGAVALLAISPDDGLRGWPRRRLRRWLSLRGRRRG